MADPEENPESFVFDPPQKCVTHKGYIVFHIFLYR
jgi:hypothetical protein